MAQLRPCPSNSFRFNSTLCACNPGYLMNPATKSCALFQPSAAEWMVKTGIDYTLTFPATILSFDTIKKFTQSQAIFLEATLVMLLSWLAFCFLVRFGKLGDGRTRWFQIRWCISRLDFCYSTRHWLEDHKVVMKRKTELGGTFSIASWILFIGLFAALLYQVISKRSVEVHNIRATNAPDLLSFNNDMEFNITTVSSMTCSHLRGLGTVVTGTPGFIDQRASPLANFANYSCHNTSQGPTISIKCNNCHIIQDNLYISWHFIDLPNDPATAVGFQFNLTARKHADEKHVSFVSGILRNVSNKDNRPVTFRGVGINILKFNLFPRLYHNFHDLRLIQPLFHEFLRGSSFSDSSQLQASLQSSTDGLINMTLYVNYLSAYIVEIDNQNVLGPVGFLADLGGLYAISIAIFFYFLVQCEYRIKKLRNEDSVLQEIRNRRKAQDHWDKLRKYVMYTWGCKTLDDDNNSARKESLCTGAMIGSFRGNGSLHKTKKQSRKDDISFNRRVDFPIKMNVIPESANQQEVKSYAAGTESNFEGQSSQGELVFEKVPGVIKDGEEYSVGPQEDAAQNQVHLSVDKTLPPPPVIDFGTDSGSNMSDIQRNLQNLYEYNVLLREKFVAAQAQLEALATKASASETKCESWQSKGA